MRILVAHSFYRQPGGEDKYVNSLVRLLGSRHRVKLLGTRNQDLGGKVQAATRLSYSRSMAAKADQELLRFKPDLIHVHNTYPSLGPSVHLAARKHAIPVVSTVHNYRLRCPSGDMFTKGEICHRCEHGAYQNALTHRCLSTSGQSAAYSAALWAHRFVLRLEDSVQLFIAPSQFIQGRLHDWGFRPNRVRLIQHFVQPSPEVSPPGSFGLFVGRLAAVKGLEVLLDALRVAGDPPFKVAGDGPLAPELVKRSAKLGLRNTEFLGRLSPDRVQTLLEKSRFVVVPSIWEENAPLAALEALGAGRPLVVSHLGGLPELAGVHRGIVVRAGDPTELANAVRKMTADSSMCARMGLAARHYAEVQLKPELHLEQLEKAYEDVLSRPPEKVIRRPKGNKATTSS